MNIKELKKKVNSCITLGELFPNGLRKDYVTYINLCHPDYAGKDYDEVLYSNILSWYNNNKNNPDWKNVRLRKLKTIELEIPKYGKYSGYLYKVNNVYETYTDGKGLNLCVPFSNKSNDLIENDVYHLRKISKSTPKDPSLDKFFSACKDYFPKIKDSFEIKTGGVYLRSYTYTHTKGDPYTIKDIIQKYPSGIHLDHMSWIFRRYLLCFHFLSLIEIKHNCVNPDNLWVDDKNHGVIITNFSNSGANPKYRNQPGYNLSDLSSLINLMSYLVSGQLDIRNSKIPNDRIELLCDLNNKCYYDLHEKYGKLLGKREFKELVI